MAKNLLLILFVVGISLSAFAQYSLEYGVMTGGANYLGEIGGKEKTRRGFIADLKLSQTKGATGVFARYKITPDIYIRSSLLLDRISGADNLSTNPGRVSRNLSFRNDIIELSFVGQYIFYDVADIGRTYRYRNDFKAYVFTGFAGYHHNPKANYNGEWVALQPLNTEGQGIVDGVPKPYSRMQFSIPAGAGFFFTFSKKYRIGWEFNWRTTFTDYLDDVSGKYADPTLLNSTTAAALSNRNPELLPYPEGSNYTDPNNYTSGNKRGDPKHKDSYISTTINVSYVLKGKSKFSRSKYKTFLQGNKFSKRRIRAKF